MSAPCSLYLCTPSSDLPPAVVAESYSAWQQLPGLWRVLLAEAGNDEPPPGEHSAGAAIVCGITPALAMLERLIGIVASHPALHRIASLPVYLAAADSWLRRQIVTFPSHVRHSLLLVAERQADALPRRPVLAGLAAVGLGLRDIAASGSYWRLDEVLGFTEDRMTFTEWRPWVERFGLDTLAHPYFRRLAIGVYDEFEQEVPAAVRFEDFSSTDEEQGDAWLGSGFRPIQVGTHVGLRFVPEEAAGMHIDADGDVNVLGDPARLALPVDGLCGVVCTETGRWLVEPTYDELAWSPGPPRSVWRVRRGQRWGLLSAAGAPLHDCVFDSMPSCVTDEYGRRAQGLRVLRDGRAGWLSHRGVMELSCAWDEVMPVQDTGLFAVKRDGAWGLATVGDCLWLPCVYEAVEPLVLADPGNDSVDWSPIGSFSWPDDTPVHALVAAGNPARANILIAVRGAHGTGVVDQSNRIIVPLHYAEVAAAENGDYRDPRWLLLTDTNGRKGLWSVEAAAEVIPCRYRHLDLYVAPGIREPLIGTADGHHYRLCHADGTPAYAEPFLSISETWWVGNKVVTEGVTDWERGKIAQAWLEGRPVRVRLADQQGTPMFLFPGKALAAVEDTLANRYWQSGDGEAALALAEDYLRGGQQEAARLWAARACGHDRAAQGPAALERREPEDHYTRCQESARFANRARIVAGLLDEGIGGPRDAALALEWARRAAAAEPVEPGPSLLLLLGKLLLDPVAGPVDRQGAIDALMQIRYPDLEEGTACLLLARVILDGPPPDLEMARRRFVRADACGVREAASELAAVLDRAAAAAGPGEATLLRREAACYRAKAAARQLAGTATASSSRIEVVPLMQLKRGKIRNSKIATILSA